MRERRQQQTSFQEETNTRHLKFTSVKSEISYPIALCMFCPLKFWITWKRMKTNTSTECTYISCYLLYVYFSCGPFLCFLTCETTFCICSIRLFTSTLKPRNFNPKHMHEINCKRCYIHGSRGRRLDVTL